MSETQLRNKGERIRTLQLSRLAEGMPGISGVFGAALAEAATICFERNRHSSGVSLQVDGSFSELFRVLWAQLEDLEQAKRTWADAQVATEHGGYAVAALLVTALTDLTVIERSRKGTGFDYWLGPKNAVEELFQNKARLEVSGIGAGSESIVAAVSPRKSSVPQKVNIKPQLRRPETLGTVPPYLRHPV